MLDRKRYRVAFMTSGLLVLAMAEAVLVVGAYRSQVAVSEPARPMSDGVRTRSTWCPSPEMRARMIRDEVEESLLTEQGAVVEEAPMARGGSR